MTILIFYTRTSGYLSRFFEEVSIRLAQDGHEVHNYSLKYRRHVENTNKVLLRVEKKGGYLKNYYQIFKIIRSVKPDAVLSNFSYVNPALLFGKIFGVNKNIVWFPSLNEQTGASLINVFIKRNFLKLADVVIANSHHTKDELHYDFKISKSKIETIPFWSSITEGNMARNVNRNSEVLKIGCPGRLVEHKNQKLILEALAYFKKIDYQFFIAGNGPNKNKLEEQCKQLGIHEQVVFSGNLSATDMISFYRDMDVVVLPSLSEAFGLVFIEAISLGCPVIVSSKFGALTFIDNKDVLESIAFDPKSNEDLIEKLKPYFNNTGLSSEYFKKIYKQNFDRDIIYARIENIILEK